MPKVNMNNLKKVEVEWVDSCASHGWGSRDYHISDFAHSNCRTTGYEIERTKDYIAIALSIGDDTRNMSEVMSIPMVCVKKIKVLR